MGELFHYGVKGMKWGVRRYQNKDGSLTSEGRERQTRRNRMIRAGKTKKDVDDIVQTFSKRDKELLGLPSNGEYLQYEQGAEVVKRILLKEGDTPVSFFDILDDGDAFNLVMATRSGEKYRGKGYATKAAQKGMDWYEKNKHRFNDKPMLWGVREDNPASIKTAKKMGFKYEKGSRWKDRDGYYWIDYKKGGKT